MERGYTKHYFEENKRVCSNIGGGFRDAGYDITEPIGLITSFEEQLGNAKDGIFNTFDQCIKSPVDLENTKDKIVNVMKDHEKDRNEEEYQFYYTNDHLGSSTYITDKKGQITQTLAYLPYGEDWVDLDNHPPYITPYKFNGKEKDEETGYNNFGARYYYDWASIWLSVDPMSDKYPHLTSYNYCANNPVMLIDPDGRDPRIYIEKNGVGHAFITAGTGKNTVVYTYGRYLGGDKAKSSSNSTDPSGRGVLIKLTGKEAQRYIKNQLKNKGANTYEITDASDNKVIEHFDRIFSSGRKLTKDEASKYNANSNKFGSSEDARVIDNYNLLNNNCTSKTIEGAKAGGTKESFLEETSSSYNPYTTGSIKVQPISPAGLDSLLKLKSQSKNSNVKNVTKSVNVEYN